MQHFPQLTKPGQETEEDDKSKLGRWYFENETGDTTYEENMFPLFVIEQLDCWPEKGTRKRTWMNGKITLPKQVDERSLGNIIIKSPHILRLASYLDAYPMDTKISPHYHW